MAASAICRCQGCIEGSRSLALMGISSAILDAYLFLNGDSLMTIDVAAVTSLQLEWTPGAVPSDVGRLSLRSIEVLPSVYQARAEGRETKRGLVDKGHVAKLAAFLKEPRKDLDPITILRVGKRNIVVDGHHRLEAYRSQKRKDIPVRWFTGSLLIHF